MRNIFLALFCTATLFATVGCNDDGTISKEAASAAGKTLNDWKTQQK